MSRAPNPLWGWTARRSGDSWDGQVVDRVRGAFELSSAPFADRLSKPLVMLGEEHERALARISSPMKISAICRRGVAERSRLPERVDPPGSSARLVQPVGMRNLMDGVEAQSIEAKFVQPVQQF